LHHPTGVVLNAEAVSAFGGGTTRFARHR